MANIYICSSLCYLLLLGRFWYILLTCNTFYLFCCYIIIINSIYTNTIFKFYINWNKWLRPQKYVKPLLRSLWPKHISWPMTKLTWNTLLKEMINFDGTKTRAGRSQLKLRWIRGHFEHFKGNGWEAGAPEWQHHATTTNTTKTIISIGPVCKSSRTSWSCLHQHDTQTKSVLPNR